MVEPRVVIPVVVGPIPTRLPINCTLQLRDLAICHPQQTVSSEEERLPYKQ